MELKQDFLHRFYSMQRFINLTAPLLSLHKSESLGLFLFENKIKIIRFITYLRSRSKLLGEESECKTPTGRSFSWREIQVSVNLFQSTNG